MPCIETTGNLCYYPDLGIAFDFLKQFSSLHDQSEASVDQG